MSTRGRAVVDAEGDERTRTVGSAFSERGSEDGIFRRFPCETCSVPCAPRALPARPGRVVERPQTSTQFCACNALCVPLSFASSPPSGHAATGQLMSTLRSVDHHRLRREPLTGWPPPARPHCSAARPERSSGSARSRPALPPLGHPEKLARPDGRLGRIRRR